MYARTGEHLTPEALRTLQDALRKQTAPTPLSTPSVPAK